MNETMDGAKLVRLFLWRGATARRVVAMGPKKITSIVAYSRRNKLAAAEIYAAMSDEQIAGAILDYAKSDPDDWPAPPTSPLRPRLLLPLALGIAGASVAGFLAPWTPWLEVEPYSGVGDILVVCSFLGAILGVVVGALAAAAAIRLFSRLWLRTAVALLAGVVVNGVLTGWLVTTQV